MKDVNPTVAKSTTSGRAAADDALTLRRTIRDLVALSALPSIWVDYDLRRSLQNLTDVLRATLRAFTVCMRAELPDGSRFETGSAKGLGNSLQLDGEVRDILDAVHPEFETWAQITKFNGGGPLNLLSHPVFSEGRRIGYFVACYKSDIFPAESDRLILQVAANQTTLLLRRHKDQEERFARKLAEERLRQTEHHYQQVVHALPAAVYTCDVDGRITLFNEAAAQLWGRRPKIGEDQWCGSWKIYNLDGTPLPLEECPMAVAIRERRSVRGPEIIVERPDGSRSVVLPHPDPIRDESGVVIGTVNMLVDVQELKRAEQALRTSEERFRSLLTLMPAAVYACDREGKITFYNHRATELWGREPKANDYDQRFTGAFRSWRPDGSPMAPAETPMAAALRDGTRTRNGDVIIERPDGSRVFVSVNIDPLHDESGKRCGAINVFQDVTQLKRAAEELRQREQHLRAVIENTPECVKLVAADGTLLEINSSGLSMVQADSLDDVVGTNIYGLIAPEHHDAYRTLHESVCAGNRERLEFQLVGLKGTRRWMSTHAAPLADSGKLLHLAITRDITEQKAQQEALQASQDRLNRLMKLMPAAMYACDADGQITYYNQRAKDLWGREPQLGDNQQKFCAAYKCWFDGKVISPEETPMAIAVRDGKAFRDLEPVFERPDGGKLSVLVNIDPLFDAEGKPCGAINVFQDITERKQAEEALKESDRKKDEFLAILAHELRNPLAPIRNGLKILQMAGNEPAIAANAELIMDQALNQLVRLVDDLLDVSRITTGKLRLRREQVELKAVVNSAVETNRPLIDERGHNLTVMLPLEPIPLDADPIRLAQVFSNLLNNSVKYTKPGGVIRLSAQSHGSAVVVRVTDNGIGIAADHLPRIFDMFAQVESAYERSQGGLGIGLSLVKRLIEMHDGTIEAHSNGPDKGSEFVIRLPVFTQLPSGSHSEPSEKPSPLQKCRILVVDDNQLSCKSLAMLLQLKGHEIATAQDGFEGIECAGTFRPDVILLDIGLPRMNGYEVARRIRQEPWGKSIFLIAITGFGQEEDRRRSIEAGFDHHMVKPVNVVELEKKLSEMAAR